MSQTSIFATATAVWTSAIDGEFSRLLAEVAPLLPARRLRELAGLLDLAEFELAIGELGQAVDALELPTDWRPRLEMLARFVEVEETLVAAVEFAPAELELAGFAA